MHKKTLGLILVVGVFAVTGIAAVLAFGNFDSDSGVVAAYKESLAVSDRDNAKHASGEIAPNFSLHLLNGGVVSLTDFKGKKPVMLYFWTTWCPNCRRNMPKLNAYYEKYKGEVALVGVNMQEDSKTIADFVAAGKISFPIALDSGSAAQAYGVQYTNTHILVGKDGNIIKTLVGDIKEEDFQLLSSL